MKSIISFLEWSDKHDRKWFIKLMIPVIGIIEYINLIIWWKFIINELLTKDEIVNWLDKQEFGIGKFLIYKKDLIETDSIFNKLDFVQAKQKISKEFVNSFGTLLDKNCDSDIENHINLLVTIDNVGNDLRCYTVKIRYWRYELAMQRLKLASIIIGLGLVTLSILLIILYYFGII